MCERQHLHVNLSLACRTRVTRVSHACHSRVTSVSRVRDSYVASDCTVGSTTNIEVIWTLMLEVCSNHLAPIQSKIYCACAIRQILFQSVSYFTIRHLEERRRERRRGKRRGRKKKRKRKESGGLGERNEGGGGKWRERGRG